MTKPGFLAILFLMLFVATVSCTQERNPCLEPTRYFLKIKTLKPADTGSAGVDSTLPGAVVGLVDTNILFADSAAANAFSGTLSSIADSVRWFVWPEKANPANGDTITFYYERKLNFLSTACGYNYVYVLNNITTTNNSIDSARIENAEITSKTDVFHVKVFY